jgi:ribonuclease T2
MPIRRHRLFCLIGLTLLATLTVSEVHSQRGAEPGRFDYYVLVLGWTPSYCATEGRKRRDGQCAAERPHAFTLHGLWPQNVEGWPEDCRTKKRPWVPQSVIDDIRDIMPSKNLVIHEYRAHGTCSGLEPAQYFGLARDLYERVGIPPRFSGADRGLRLTEREIEAEFLKSNAWLKPNMDRGKLPRPEPARCAHLLRPRPFSKALRIERRATHLPRGHDQRAGSKTTINVGGD